MFHIAMWIKAGHRRPSRPLCRPFQLAAEVEIQKERERERERERDFIYLFLPSSLLSSLLVSIYNLFQAFVCGRPHWTCTATRAAVWPSCSGSPTSSTSTDTRASISRLRYVERTSTEVLRSDSEGVMCSRPDHNFRPKKNHFLFLFSFDAEVYKTCKNTIKLIYLCGLPCLGLGLWLTMTVYFDLA